MTRSCQTHALTTAFSPVAAPGGVAGDEDRTSATAPAATLAMACCDPAAGLLASAYARATGFRLLVLPRASRQALALLGQGLVHVAGAHFATTDHPDGNA